MADTIPLPSLPLNKDTEPAEGSEAWHLVQENRAKRKNFGAGIGFVADEKIRTFVFEMSFKSKTDANNMTINLYQPHKEFIAKLLEITEGDAHVMPTARARTTTSDATHSTKSPIISVAAFPTTTYQHGQFFDRTMFYSEKTKRTVVKIKHQVLMKETVAQVKKKMMDYLQEKKIWLKNGDLDAVETSGFGWMLAAHDTMVFRPALKNTLTMLIQKLPTDVLEDTIAKFGTPDDLVNLPELFVNPKWQAFGNSSQRVQTHAVTLSCVNNKIRLMKELVCLIPHDTMPYAFIHLGLATTNTPEAYWKYVIINNDRQNAVQGITVRGFSAELLGMHWVDADNVTATVANHFLSHPAILSIEETHTTAESGRFIFIVYKTEFLAAQSYILNFCKNVFPALFPMQDDQDNYKISYQNLPHVVDSPNAGGAVGAHGNHLVNLLAQAETDRGKPFSMVSTTWAEKVAPRMIFDQSSEFPALPDKKRKSKSAATSIAKDDSTVGTNNSSSTIAATSKTVNSTGQTLASTDVSTAISDMRSVITDMFEKQASVARQAAADAKFAVQEAKKEAKEVAAEAKRDALEAAHIAKQDAIAANDRMQTFLVTLIKTMMHQKRPSSRPIKTSKRPSTTEQRLLSPMWQASRRSEDALMTDVQEADYYSGDGHSQTPSEDSFDQFYSTSPDGEEEATSNESKHTTAPITQPTPLLTHVATPTELPPLKKHNNNGSPMKLQESVLHNSSSPTTLRQLPNPPPRRTPRSSPAPSTESKINSTGTAPKKPSSLAATARALNFEGMKQGQHTTVPAAPDPSTGPTLHQE